MRYNYRTADAPKPRTAREAKAKGAGPRKPTAAQVARAARLLERERFLKARKAERQYARQLRQIARHVGQLVAGFAPKGIVGEHEAALQATLNRYGEQLRPWATAVTKRMLMDVSQRDERAWREHGNALGRDLATELRTAPTGKLLRSLLDSQVELITSLPREAGQRVHKLTVQALSNSARAKDLQREILRTGHVTANRAMLIARTETSRTAANLTKVRAQHLGSIGYVWHTVGDADVRPSHKRMAGTFVRWDEPPTLDNLEGHAGCTPNCRCWPHPVLPDASEL